MDPTRDAAPVLAAIDVGTNAARLELVRALPDGALETLHYERAPIRPGEGVFETGIMDDAVADRLVGTMQRFAVRCERQDAEVRAVATSAMRDARNADAVLERVLEHSGIQLEVISGREEARLICLGVCRGRPRGEHSLVLDIGGGSTEIALADGSRPTELWSVALGAVRLTEMFETHHEAPRDRVDLMRAHAEQALDEVIADAARDVSRWAFGSSGTIRAVVGFASAGETSRATASELTAAVERLLAMSSAERLDRFGERRADIIVAGAVILETLSVTLGLESITAVDRGLRNGILVDLQERAQIHVRDRLLGDEALDVGRRFQFEEAHGRQVARLALDLFDGLGAVHGLDPQVRSVLEVAAWLHDVGKAVSFQRHHRHGQYLIQHTEILGLVDHERTLAAHVVRFHRRSPPEASHAAMKRLSDDDARVVRRLSTILRLADAFDRSHQQRVERLDVTADTGADENGGADRAAADRCAVRIELRSSRDLQLEMWDAQREATLFERVFDCTLTLTAAAPGAAG